MSRPHLQHRNKTTATTRASIPYGYFHPLEGNNKQKKQQKWEGRWEKRSAENKKESIEREKERDKVMREKMLQK